MSEISLPGCWAEIELGNIARFIDYRGKTPVKTATGIPLITAKNIRDGFINREPREFIAEEDYELWMTRGFPQLGDIVITTEAPMGNVASIDITEKFALAQRAICLQLKIKEMNRFSMYQLRSGEFKEKLNEHSTGTTVKGIKAATLKQLKLKIPPLAEQQQIAQKLDELLAQVDTLKTRLDAIPKILKRFRQSVLAAAVSGRLTEEWRGGVDAELLQNPLPKIQTYKRDWSSKNKDHNEVARVEKRLNAFNLEEDTFPLEGKGWLKSKLEDCVLMVVDCHNKTAPYVEAGIPLVRTPNIRNGKFVWSDLKFVDESTYEFWSKRCKPEAGDLVFTREAPMGEVAVIPSNIKICLGQRTMLFRPVEPFCSAKYLTLCLMDPVFRENSEKNSVGTGVKHYRVGDVSDLFIPVPSVAEQTEIVRRVEQLFAYADQIEQRVKDAQARVNHLTQSILAKAFRGELTADWRAQNPELISGENSAAALLGRIRVEREVVVKKGGKKAAVAAKR